MSTTSYYSDKRTDQQPRQQRNRHTGPRHNPLGVDTTGAHHYWNRHTQTILVITPDGDIEHREDLHEHAGKDVQDWASYVASERGWSECKLITLSARDLAHAQQ